MELPSAPVCASLGTSAISVADPCVCPVGEGLAGQPQNKTAMADRPAEKNRDRTLVVI
jgi:hypothetical protein